MKEEPGYTGAQGNTEEHRYKGRPRSTEKYKGMQSNKIHEYKGIPRDAENMEEYEGVQEYRHDIPQ